MVAPTAPRFVRAVYNSLIVPRAPWLLTAFEPFSSRPRNASAMVLDAMCTPAVATRLLPVVFDALADEVAALLDMRPEILILMGESGQRNKVHVERIALNVLDAHGRADNRGVLCRERPVVADGPLARLATWDAERVVEVLRSCGVPAHKSYHAGSYACNQVLYLALSQAERMRLDIPIGFLHVPSKHPSPADQARQLASALPRVFEALSGGQP